MNIVLIGYRGCGKSEVAEKLGQALKMQVVSLDEQIVEDAGMTIPDIVAKEGWDYFRAIEKRLCHKFCSEDNLIIDSGGGVILDDENRKAIRNNNVVFWLKAETDTIAKRIGSDTNRPALVDGKTFIEEIEEVLNVRLPLYKECADHEIDTDSICTDEVSKRILATLDNQ